METVSSSVDLSDLLIPRRDGEERRGKSEREQVEKLQFRVRGY